jgi:hypothetical protein
VSAGLVTRVRAVETHGPGGLDRDNIKKDPYNDDTAVRPIVGEAPGNMSWDVSVATLQHRSDGLTVESPLGHRSAFPARAGSRISSMS